MFIGSEEDERLKAIAEARFYEMIGRCITSWSKVENELFRFCELSLKTSIKNVSIVFFRLPTLSSRLEFTDEVVQALLPPKLKKNGGHDDELTKEWKSLVAEAKSLLPFRNLLAHSPVTKHSRATVQVDDKGGGRLRSVELIIMSQTNPYETIRGRGTPKQTGLFGMEEHLKSLDRLYVGFHSCRSRLQGETPPRSPSPEAQG